MKTPLPLENRFAPHLALLAVQMLFGSAPALGKAALQAFPAAGIVGFRVGGAALAFLILQKLNGGLQLGRSSDYWRFALYSLLGVVLNQLFFITGLSLTTATNTSLLAVLIPVFATLIAAMFGFDFLSWRKIIGIAAAACGVIYLVNPAQASFSADTTRGDLMIILNCVFYATYIAVSKDAVARNGALKSLAWLFFFGSLFCVPFAVFSMRAVDFAAVSQSAWLAVAAMVVFPTICAYYLNAWALARVAPSTVAVYIYLQPLIGFTLAVLFLNEPFSLRSVIAGLLIFTGVFLVTLKTRNQKYQISPHESLQ